MEKWQWLLLALIVAVSAGFAEVFPSGDGNVTVYKWIANKIGEATKK